MAAEHHTDTIITDVTFEDYWDTYAAQGYEWVGAGMVKMPAVYDRHDKVSRYLDNVFEMYLKYRPVGELRGDQCAMRFEYDDETRSRLPDLQIVIDPTPDRLTETAVIGPADLIVEIVSLESVERDYVTKRIEYEAIGVREYWIIDPLLKRAEFHQLDQHGIYQRGIVDPEGHYHSVVLSDLVIDVPTLWRDPLPDIEEVVIMLRQQLGIDR